MKTSGYIYILSIVVSLFALGELRRKMKPKHNRFIDGTLCILLSSVLLWLLFVKYPKFALAGAIVLRSLPILGGILLFFIANQSKFYGGKMEYLVQAISRAALLAGFFFVLPLWAQWGILIAGSAFFYAWYRLFGMHDYSNKRAFKISVQSAAWVSGSRRRADGKYDDPKFQAILDDLEMQDEQVNQKED